MEIIEEYKNVNGDYDKSNGPAVVFNDGSYVWYHNGKEHNENGIAKHIVNVGDFYFVNGLQHRLDGPAVIWYSLGVPNDHLIEPKIKMKEWWYSGKHIICSCQEEFERLIGLKAFW